MCYNIFVWWARFHGATYPMRLRRVVLHTSRGSVYPAWLSSNKQASPLNPLESALVDKHRVLPCFDRCCPSVSPLESALPKFMSATSLESALAKKGGRGCTSFQSKESFSSLLAQCDPLANCSVVFKSLHTLPFYVSSKSFVCRSYENCRGVGVFFPIRDKSPRLFATSLRPYFFTSFSSFTRSHTSS
jgi:hypothetical protein